MKKLWIALVAVIVLMGGSLSVPANAQESVKLDFDRKVSGKLSSGADQATFDFDADKGDVVIVQLLPDTSDSLIGGEIKITSDQDQSLADSSALIIMGRLGSIISAPIDKTGAFTVTVFADSTSSGGGFSLILSKAIPLSEGKTVKGSVKSTPNNERVSYGNFYVLTSTADMVLTYTKTGGDYNPAVLVNSVESGNNVFPMEYMGGVKLGSGSLTIPGDKKSPRIISVGSLDFAGYGSSSEKQLSANYTLTATAAK